MDLHSQLQDIEDIRTLKAKYARYIDTKQWEKWAALFTSDYEAVVDGPPRMTRSDPTQITQSNITEIAAGMAQWLASIVTIHRVFMPEITLTSERSATGTWGINDIIFMPTNRFEGWGHYHDEYIKDDDVWKIRRLKVTRLAVEEQWYDEPRGSR